jgi:hypothetical protein
MIRAPANTEDLLVMADRLRVDPNSVSDDKEEYLLCLGAEFVMQALLELVELREQEDTLDKAAEAYEKWDDISAHVLAKAVLSSRNSV